MATLAAVVFSGCAERKEVARVTAPDALLDAVVVESQGALLAATTRPVKSVYIVPRGARPPTAREDAVFRARQAGVRPRWRDPRFLELHYDPTMVIQFRNFWYPVSGLADQNRVVEVRLVPPPGPWSLSPRDRLVDPPFP